MSYEFENIINCRDLGGIKCKEKTTLPGKVIRCGIPKEPTENDIKFLKENNIKTIIDLRGVKEAEERPSPFATDDFFNYHHITLLEANPALNDVNLPLWRMYALSLTHYSDSFREVFKQISQIKGKYMFHCFLGKDRTGILSALLLYSAGAEMKDILKDYELSYNYVKPFVEKEIRENTGLIWEQDYSRFRSDGENIIKLFDFLKEKYGGVTQYLLSVGLTQEEINLAGNTLF